MNGHTRDRIQKYCCTRHSCGKEWQEYYKRRGFVPDIQAQIVGDILGGARNISALARKHRVSLRLVRKTIVDLGYEVKINTLRTPDGRFASEPVKERPQT